MAAVLLSSCKKDEAEKDSRDQFVGTYTGTQIVIVPELEMSDSFTGTMSITKSNEASKILINDGSVTQKAYVTGSKYEYEKFSQTETVEGTTITMELTGSGTLANGVLTESGIVTYYFLGKSFVGTWSATFTKQ